ncbi:MAG: LicD family protein [Bacteroidota bacterium]
MRRIFQYIQRWANIYLTTIPGNYQARKLEILKNLFEVVNNFLMDSGEEYWLDFGTLLGYHREGGIIPHDIDVDFSMMEKSYDKVVKIMHKLPRAYKFYDTSYRHNGPKLYISYKGFDADVYFYQEIGDEVRSTEKTKWPNERQLIPKNLIIPLTTAEFLNQKTFVPKNPKAYLEYVYGYLGKDGMRNKQTGLWEKKSI